MNYFGITQPPGEDTRGRSFMFWNLAGFNGGTPLLAALVSGRAARDAEEDDSTQGLTQHTLQVWGQQQLLHSSRFMYLSALQIFVFF